VAAAPKPRAARELRVRVEGQFILNGTTPILNAALAGLGLAYVPEDMAQPYLADGRLKRVLEAWCAPYSDYHLYYPSRRQSSPAFALLVDALRGKSAPLTHAPETSVARKPRIPALFCRSISSPK
jgi:DNA-binding transcriptional LysR family regulator